MKKFERYFVTDRSYELLRHYLHLVDKDIQKIPQNGNVLEVGSGVYRNFTSGLVKDRPDLKVYSVDPSLGILSEEFVSFVERNDEGKIETVTYTNQLVEKNSDFFRGRIEELKKVLIERLGVEQPSVVVSFAPNLPFRNESFDLIVDVFGAGFYLHEKGRSEFENYISTIYNLLKQGGEARIYPVLNTKSISYSTDEELKKASLVYYQNVLEKLALDFEVSFEEIRLIDDPSKSNLLMILRKK